MSDKTRRERKLKSLQTCGQNAVHRGLKTKPNATYGKYTRKRYVNGNLTQINVWTIYNSTYTLGRNRNRFNRHTQNTRPQGE